MTVATPTREPTALDELSARALVARDGDLEGYASAVHDLEFQPYQPAWAEGLGTLNRICLVCPPDTFKSTTVRLYVEREIGRNPNIRILWLMNSGEQAVKQVMTVAQTIKGNPFYKAAFPETLEDTDAQWTKSVLYVKRTRIGPDPTLMATGLNGPYQGLHFDIIIIDDPTNQEDVYSPTTMTMQETKVRGVIIDRLVPGGRIVALLTRWGGNDLVPTFAEMGFTVIEMPVIADYPWGPTLSPTRFTEERLEEIRKDKGDVLFQLTYMCNAEAASGNIIKREHLQYWGMHNLPEAPLAIFLGIDPAASLDTHADNSAIATVGIDIRTRKKYLLDIWAGRLEVPDLKKKIVKMCQNISSLRGVGLETAGFQISMLQDMRRQYNLPFKEIPYRTRRRTAMRGIAIDRNKIGRAMYLDSLLTSDRLLLPKSTPLVDGVSLETELCSIGARWKGHDDRMDAITFACVIADAGTGGKRPITITAFKKPPRLLSLMGIGSRS